MWNFLIFFQRYIQNTGIFRNRGIFRTLSTIYDGTFRKKKKSHLAHFLAQPWIKKKNPIQKIPFISGNGTLHFLSSRTKNKNNLHEEYFLYSRKFLIFYQEKAFLIFQGTITPKKSPYISRKNFPSSKNQKHPLLKSFLYFWKQKVLASSLKHFLYISGRNWQGLKILLFKRMCKRFLILFLIKKQHFPD